MINYEILRHPGIRGSVPANHNSFTVYNTSQDSIKILTAKLGGCDAFDFGFKITIGDKQFEKAPGIGSGWFSSEQDAAIYALSYILDRCSILSDSMKAALSKELHSRCQHSLF